MQLFPLVCQWLMLLAPKKFIFITALPLSSRSFPLCGPLQSTPFYSTTVTGFIGLTCSSKKFSSYGGHFCAHIYGLLANLQGVALA
jgi:hypothetical protein